MRRELGGQCIYYQWSKVVPGETITGKYIGTRTDDYDKINWILRDEEGQEHILNHCGSLARKMSFAKKGQVLEIVYEGKETVKLKKYGTKPVHQFKVYCTSDEAASVDDIEDRDDDDLNLDDLGSDSESESESESKSKSSDGLDDFDDDDLDLDNLSA